MEQNRTECDFAGAHSWVILSPIEQSIKNKIEAIGKPLKDWDINIYRGVLTGFNEAFIISTDKRNEILDNCLSDDERKRTEALIRPILRGRDIKRYGYDWANLWLIATFPSRHYDIEEYPAVKEYLLSFGMQRLEQTGKSYNVGATTVKARKKTNNKWYETQDSISYWEDFQKPKILWKRIGSILRFCYTETELLGLDSTCFLTGSTTEYLCCILNSKMGHYLLKDAPKTGTGDLLISVQAIEPLRIPTISETENNAFKKLINDIHQYASHRVEDLILDKIFNLYQLSDNEKNYIVTMFS